MQEETKVFRLKGVIQHYNWGGKGFLTELIGEKNNGDQPSAEYWMGAHVNAPSTLDFPDGKKQTLDSFLSTDIEIKLGTKVAREFGRLPYLFKVLDVKDMLSIQVHPGKKAAEKEFAKEQLSGLALNAPTRNYKDDNHKPELMLALSEFYLLHGFKAPAQLKHLLSSVTELNFLLPTWEENGYEGIYKEVMQMSQSLVNEKLMPLVSRVLTVYEKGQLNKWQEDFWAARAYKTFCSDGNLDRGLFSIYFFNIVKLSPGEAIFQDAGILHAYLEGQNLEIMANSDNVLRGGLTNKHVDVPELLKHVRFEPTYPVKITGKKIGEEQVFQTTAADFELRRIDLAAEEKTIQVTTADIFLVMDGSVEISQNGASLSLGRGECFLAIAGASLRLKARQVATLYHASVPL